MKQIRKRLTYANVMSSLAVFLILGGATAFAASKKIGANELKANAITTGKIVKEAVTAGKIKTGAVTETKIADGAVTTNKIADNAVSTSKIANNAVTESKIAGNAVTNGKIADNAVTTGKIANNAVTTGKLANGSVTKEKLGAGSVTSSSLGALTDRSASGSNIAAGGFGSASVTCEPGETVISGGNDSFNELVVVASRRNGNGWIVFGNNLGATAHPLTVHAYCLAP